MQANGAHFAGEAGVERAAEAEGEDEAERAVDSLLRERETRSTIREYGDSREPQTGLVLTTTVMYIDVIRPNLNKVNQKRPMNLPPRKKKKTTTTTTRLPQTHTQPSCALCRRAPHPFIQAPMNRAIRNGSCTTT